MNRRTFLAAATSTASVLAAPYVRSQSKTSLQGAIIGHGAYRYQVDYNWCQADPAKHPVKSCHEMVMDSQKRLILITDDARNNILIFDKEGRVLDAWTLKLRSGHGLTLDARDGAEYLYLCDPGGGRVVKTTLKGEVLLELPNARDCGAYDATAKYAPTEAAVGPNGDI